MKAMQFALTEYISEDQDESNHDDDILSSAFGVFHSHVILFQNRSSHPLSKLYFYFRPGILGSLWEIVDIRNIRRRRLPITAILV